MAQSYANTARSSVAQSLQWLRGHSAAASAVKGVAAGATIGAAVLGGPVKATIELANDVISRSLTATGAAGDVSRRGLDAVLPGDGVPTQQAARFAGFENVADLGSVVSRDVQRGAENLGALAAEAEDPLKAFVKDLARQSETWRRVSAAEGPPKAAQEVRSTVENVRESVVGQAATNLGVRVNEQVFEPMREGLESHRDQVKADVIALAKEKTTPSAERVAGGVRELFGAVVQGKADSRALMQAADVEPALGYAAAAQLLKDGNRESADAYVSRALAHSTQPGDFGNSPLGKAAGKGFEDALAAYDGLNRVDPSASGIAVSLQQVSGRTPGLDAQQQIGPGLE